MLVESTFSIVGFICKVTGREQVSGEVLVIKEVGLHFEASNRDWYLALRLDAYIWLGRFER